MQTRTPFEDESANPCDPCQREGIGFLYSSALAGISRNGSSTLVDRNGTNSRAGFEGDPPTNPGMPALNHGQPNRTRRWFLQQAKCMCKYYRVGDTPYCAA